MLNEKKIDVYEHALLHLMQENEQLRNDLWKSNERLKRNGIRTAPERAVEGLGIETKVVDYPKSWFRGDEYR